MPVPEGIVARDICPEGYFYSDGRCYAESAWYWWGRWVLAGIIILFFIFVFVLLGCINSRRRRRRGLTPMYGTGWMAPQHKYGQQQQHQQWAGGYGQQQQYGPPPPKYGEHQQQYQYGPQAGVGQQYTGTTFQTQDGYYGGHSEGVVQPPPNTYQSVYSPPAGPPPGK